MQAKDDISEELNLLRFPYVDRLPSPYQIPERYFNSFPQRVLQLAGEQDAAIEQAGIASGLPAADHSGLPYVLPEDYFSAFPSRMAERIRTELFDASDLEALKASPIDRNPFQLEDGRYFETLATQLLARIKKASEETPEDALPPVLAKLKGKNVFEVPAGYFEGKVTIPEAIQKPLIPAHPAHKSIKWSSWIAAAGILLIFTLGGRGLFVSSPSAVSAGDSGLEVALNALSEQEISEYLEMTMNEYELAGFYADNASWNYLPEEQARKQLLNDIPIEDIKAYVDGGGF